MYVMGRRRESKMATTLQWIKLLRCGEVLRGMWIWIRVCEGMLKERPGIGNERQVVCIARRT